jgi:hypothetical protein
MPNEQKPTTGRAAKSRALADAQEPVSARLLRPVDVPPVMAFGHDIDPGLVARLVYVARVALR